MHTFLYVVWFLIPAFFFILALWSSLERFGDKEKRSDSNDLLYQGTFMLVCVGISVVIDSYFLQSIHDSFLPDSIPLGFLQVLLLPVVVYLSSIIWGPSKPLRISKAPRPSEANRNKRKR